MALYSIYRDEQLVVLLRNDDDEAFVEIYNRYWDKLLAIGYNHAGSKEAAEEIVQDVFTKLWEGRANLTSVEYPGKYIYTIARNKTLNHLTKLARDRRLLQQIWVNVSQSDNATEDLLQAQESQQLINEAVNRLSVQWQTIFQLSREQGLTHEEIAARLGLSKSRVKNILVEILKHIREYLARYSVILSALFCTNWRL